MKTHNIMGLLVSAVVVNCAVAACSGPESVAVAGTGGTSSSVGTGAVPETTTGTGSGGGCTCEVKKPELVTEFCNHSFVTGSSTYWYAEHIYPGSSIADLALVVALQPYTFIGSTIPAEFTTTRALKPVVISDGKVAIECPGDNQQTTSVIFVKP